MDFSLPKRELAVLAVVLTVSLVIRVLLFPQKGYEIDTNCFTSWMSTAASQGISPFYNAAGFADYPPFNVYVFWFFGSAANLSGIGIENIIKWVPNIFDLVTAIAIFYFVRQQSSFKIAITATAFYTFNAAVIYNTSVWGQYDALYTMFLVISLMFALKSKPELSAAAFALGILTKPQGIALLPLIVLLIYKKNGAKRLLTSVAAFTAVVFLVIAPFQFPDGNPISFLTKIYFDSYSYYHYTSINAFNLWGMVGMWVPDGNLYLVGWAMFIAVAAFTLFVVHKRYGVSGDYLVIFAAFMLFFSFFMLPTRIHERYMFPAMAMLALMFPMLKKTRLLYGVLTGTLFVNQAYVLYHLNAAFPNAPNLTGDPVVLIVGAVNLLMLVYASLLLWFELRGYGWLKPQSTAVTESPQVKGEPESTST